jgi:predicted Zn-dependent protease
LIKNKKLKEAEKKINTLLKNNPKEPEFYNLQGLLDTINKQPELAIKNHQKAIALDQKNLKAHLSIAKIALDTGNITQAKKHANKAISINDSSTYAYFLLADIARIQNKPQKAETVATFRAAW